MSQARSRVDTPVAPRALLLLTAVWLGGPGQALAQETLVVRQDGEGDAFTSISAALEAVPKKPDTHYVIEIQDSETYEEAVVIAKKTSETATLTVRAQAGQTPRVVAAEKKTPAVTVSSPYVTLEGLFLQGGSRQSGVHLDWADFATIRNCVVQGARDKTTPGIYVQGATHGQIVGNTITDNEVGILVFNTADENTFGNNLIFENGSRGIWLYRKSAGNLVIDNTLYDNGLEIHLGNTGKKKDEPGEANEFRDNIIVAGEDGVCVAVDRQNDPGELPDATVSDYNNLHVAAPGASVGRLDKDTYADLEAWRHGSGVDLHSLSEDPLFVGSGDFHLQSSAGSYHGGDWRADEGHSPSIDTADPSSAYAEEPDPNGSRANMGAYGNTAQASLSAPPQPRGDFDAVAQATDGSGRVEVSIEVNHAAGVDTRARIEWSTEPRTGYALATLAGPVVADFDDSGGPPDIDNGSRYQLGSGADTRIVTSQGSNTVTSNWLSGTDAPTADGTLWLKLTVNDDTEDQRTPAVTQVSVDNAAPAGMGDLAGTSSTSRSITWGWTPVSTETHFDQYFVYFGVDRDDVVNRTGSAVEWNAEDDPELATMATETTTITGLSRATQYFAQLWARDQLGHEARTAVAEYTTANQDTVTHYVAATGSVDGTPNDPSRPWSSIQRAVNAIPGDLSAAETYYFVQVLDSERYRERVTIDKTTETAYSITLQAAGGQSPTVAAPNGQFGVVVKSDHVVVEGFTIQASNKYAVDVNEADHAIIRNCVIFDGTNGDGGGVRLLRADSNRLENNRIHTNTIGVNLGRDADFNTLRNNLIIDDDGRDAGVYFGRDADGDSLINNTIVGHENGLSFKGGDNHAGDDHVLRNTIIDEVDVCIDLGKALGNTFAESDYNDLSPAAGGDVAAVGNTSYSTLADWRTASGLDGNSKSVDPIFVDASGSAADRDLHLRSQKGHWSGRAWVNDDDTSPAIDAGDPADDFGNETAPNGNRINAGAYGNTVEASRSAARTLVQGGLPYAEYVMMGVPLIPEDGNPDAVLSDDFPGEGEDPWGFWWALARWNTPQADYQYYNEELGLPGNPPDFLPGQGYWLIQWWSIVYEDGSTEGDTVSVTGTSVKRSEDFVIPLVVAAGSRDDDDDDDGAGTGSPNQLANPFPFTIDWGNAKIRDRGNGREVSVARAAAAGLIDGFAYLWDWENQTYRPVPASGGRLRRWQGFWVIQLDDGRQLDLVLPPTAAPVASAGKVLAHRPTALDWYAEFSVTTQPDESAPIRQDLHNRAGVSEAASRRFDSNDALDLPSLGTPFVHVYFAHDDPEDPDTYWSARPGRYTYDIRDPEWDEQEWEFVVETDLTDTEMVWEWTNPEGLPRGYRMALEDADGDSVLIPDLEAQTDFRFSSGPTGLRTFRLRAEFEDVAGDVSGDRLVDADDAAQILDHALGLETLPDYALELADVSGGTGDAASLVSPYDASWVLRYASDLIEAFPVEGGAEDALLGRQRSVHLSEPLRQEDGTFDVPVVIDDLTDVFSGVVQMTYDPAELEVVDVVMPDAGRYDRALVVADGDLRFAFAGAVPGVGRATFAHVVVRAAQASQDVIDHIQLAAVQLDEGLVSARILSPRPEEHFLYPPAPNPFNSTVTIRFGLPEAEFVTLSIYNILGQRVQVLANGRREAGLHAATWDGRDRKGRALATGAYFVRLEAGERRMVHKIAYVQ